jgi:hypothetical protein
MGYTCILQNMSFHAQKMKGEIMMRSKRITIRFCACLLASAVVPLICISVGHATTFIRTTLKEMCALSSDIVIARVISMKSYLRQEQRRIFTDVELEVDEMLKGQFEKRDRIRLIMYGGTVDGITTTVVGAADFTIGERSVLFLLARQSSQFGRNFVVVGMSQGKFDIFVDQATAEEKVIRDQINLPLQGAAKQSLSFGYPKRLLT